MLHRWESKFCQLDLTDLDIRTQIQLFRHYTVDHFAPGPNYHKFVLLLDWPTCFAHRHNFLFYLERRHHLHYLLPNVWIQEVSWRDRVVLVHRWRGCVNPEAGRVYVGAKRISAYFNIVGKIFICFGRFSFTSLDIPQKKYVHFLNLDISGV